MKILAEVLVGVAACGVAYYLARPDPPDRVRDSTRSDTATRDSRRPSSIDARGTSGMGSPASRTFSVPRARAKETLDAVPSAEQQHAMATLRNALISATSADMHRRGEDVTSCLAGVELAGTQKLRFSVDVVSTAREAIAGPWRFVEIVDGELLPDSFGACAARALGGGQRLVPPDGFEFPEYRGALPILYTISAPRSE